MRINIYYERAFSIFLFFIYNEYDMAKPSTWKILKIVFFLGCVSCFSLFSGFSSVPPFQEKESEPVPESLMADLIEKSKAYEEYALRFFCTEMLREASYDSTSGEADKEKRSTYEYLLEANPDQGSMTAYRQKVIRTGTQIEKREVKLEYNFPEPYSWIYIFSGNFRNVMKYGYEGKEIYAYKLAHIISFRGFQPFTDGKDIRQWEGRVWVEQGTYNILRVEAEPIHQDDVLEMKRQEYNQAFSFIGIRFKKRPFGHRVAVLFDFEHDGLAFPTETRNETFELVAKNTTMPSSALIFNYADYHFFRTETKEEITSPEFR